MTAMKAIVKQNKESNDFILTEIPIPEISDDEILVKVKAIGVGIQDGYFFPEEMNFPYPIGMEGSGIVEKVGKNITEFIEGERIAFVGVTEPKGGSYAEYMVLGKKSLLVSIPDEMNFIEAAAIPVSGDQFKPERDIKSIYFPYSMDVKEELKHIIDKIVSGDISITIENVYEFQDGLDALEKVKTRRARGKSIIVMK